MTKLKTKIIQKENQIIFSLKTKNYPLEAIYSAAYVFVDRAYVYLDGSPEKEINVFLKGKELLNKKQLESLQGEFLNELLNYLVRIETARMNQKIREYVVASALVSALPQEVLGKSPDTLEKSSEDWQNDPLGIAVSWESKKSANKKGKKSKSKKNK